MGPFDDRLNVIHWEMEYHCNSYALVELFTSPVLDRHFTRILDNHYLSIGQFAPFPVIPWNNINRSSAPLDNKLKNAIDHEMSESVRISGRIFSFHQLTDDKISSVNFIRRLSWIICISKNLNIRFPNQLPLKMILKRKKYRWTRFCCIKQKKWFKF